MSDTKPVDPAAADPTPDTKVAIPDVELTDADLAQVSGGMMSEPVASRTKSADKTATAVDTLIRG
jgi:hypothetical protein